METLALDGSQGEGGGQILRSALALSLLTGQPFELRNIRAGRPKPGLRPQHLLSVTAAAEVGRAQVQGARLASRRLVFDPQAVTGGEYRFELETAGSTSLIAQTVLPPLTQATSPSTLILRGGTHNPFAPPYDFLDAAFLRLTDQMGWRVERTLVQPGFYPRGRGRVELTIGPAQPPQWLDLLERGELVRREATVHLARLPDHVGERERRRILEALEWSPEEVNLERHPSSMGPANAIVARLDYEHVTEVIIAHGERGRPAEHVADHLIHDVLAYQERTWPVGGHLADQLLLPLAIGCGGRYRTGPLTPHTTTNIDTLRRFLPKVQITCQPQSDRSVLITVEPSRPTASGWRPAHVIDPPVSGP